MALRLSISVDFGVLSIDGEFAKDEIRGFAGVRSAELIGQRFIGVDITSELARFHEIESLRLWAPVVRASMKHIIKMPRLREIEIASLRHPGQLEDFSASPAVEHFRCGFMREADVLEVARLPALKIVGAQNADMTPAALRALLAIDALIEMDLEASGTTDAMVVSMAERPDLVRLDLGANPIGVRALIALGAMRELESLDLWAADIVADDIAALADLPKLSYLALGRRVGQSPFDVVRLIARLSELPALKRLWLDGVRVTIDQRLALAERFEVRVDATPE